MKRRREPGDQHAKADRYIDAILEVYSPYARPKVMLFFGTAAEWNAITKGARDFLRLRRKYAR